MSDFDDISALLKDVLNEEDDATDKDEQQVITPDPEPEPEPEPVSEVDEIDRLIAEAAADKSLETPEPPDEDEVVTSDDLVSEPVDTEVPTVGNEELFTKGAGTDAIKLPEFTSDEIMDQIDIRNFGTLVKLTTARWHAKIKDKEVAREMAQAKSADENTYEGYKLLLAGCDEKLKRIHSAIDAARSAHYALTLPWSVVSINDTGRRAGPRLLPNTLFMEYTTEMAAAKQEMETALDEFEQVYPNLVQQAQSKMGAAFNATDYPHMDVIRTHFNLHFEFAPIPKGADFDGIQQQMADKLAETLDAKTRTSLENAMQEAWLRLYKTVGHAAETLSNPDKTFHYTMVDKLRDQASYLKHLNATGDQTIEDVRAIVEDKLTKYDPKEIRKDDALRKRMADIAMEAYNLMKERAGEA